MEIHSAAFDIIHDLVGQKHFLRLTPQERRHKTTPSQDLWNVTRDGILLISDAIEPFSSAFNIIKTERTRIRKDTIANGFAYIDDRFVISLLRFLELDKKDRHSEREIVTLNPQEIRAASIDLMTSFLKEKFPSYLNEFPKLSSAFNIEGDKQDSLKRVEYADQEKEPPIRNISPNSELFRENMNDELVDFVKRYFELLHQGEYVTAFDFWQSDGKDVIFNHDVFLFRDSFFKRVGYEGLNVLNSFFGPLGVSPYRMGLGTCTVLFIETISIPIHEIIDKLELTSLNGSAHLLDDFLFLFEYKEDFKRNKLENYFAKLSSEKITNAPAEFRKDLKKMLPKITEHRIARVYDVNAVHEPLKGWKISHMNCLSKTPTILVDPYFSPKPIRYREKGIR